MITYGGPRPLLVASPRRVVAVGELAGASRILGVVTSREHRARDRVEQVGRRVVAALAALGDVARAAGPPGRGGRRRRGGAVVVGPGPPLGGRCGGPSR